MRWLDHSSWDVVVGCNERTVVGSFKATNNELGVSIVSTDVVHNEHNVLLRSFCLRNTKKGKREVKIFFSQQFRISESRRGDTGFYDPRVRAIVHYKGHHYFLINVVEDGVQFTDYSIGLFDIEGLSGTYHDAEDGMLEHNPIEHGSVDSIIGMTCTLKEGEEKTIHYWIACGKDINEVHDLNSKILEETPEVLIKSTENYWKAWITKDARDLSLISPELVKLYNRSLTTIRVHTDNGGGIIASSDTDMLHHGRDTYSYVWPRDASLIAHALDKAGYQDVSKKCFSFLAARIERGGYLMHKYRSDGVLGSSWHPWVHGSEPILPIQEDETSTTLYMLWEHYSIAHDLEFIESLYNPFIEPAAEFMCEYMESSVGLPRSSYDLWEEKYLISTHTSSSVFAGMYAAAQFANLLGKQEAARRYQSVAQHIRSSIVKHLYDPDIKMFVKGIMVDNDGEISFDKTIDMSSFFGPVYYGVLDPNDEKIIESHKTVFNRLQIHTESEGYIRYENDSYYKMQDAGSPNPWVITTLWMAQYYIMKAKNIKELERAYHILEWTCRHATKSGVLAEQMHPHTMEHLSTAPLIWSHAEFIISVDAYIKRHKEFTGDVCD